jgi:outer membrane protein
MIGRQRLWLGAAVLVTILFETAAVAETAGARSPAPPSPPTPLTLSAAIDEALRRRPLLAGDAERIAAAQARVGQARAGLQPRFDVQASATDGPLGAPPMGLGGLAGTPIKKHTGGSLNMILTLLDFGRVHNTVRARREEAGASAEVLRADQNRVTLEVQQAYLQALQARRLLAVNTQILEQRQLVARQAQTLQQNGLTSRVDVDLAEVNVSQAQLAVVRARNDIETAFAALGTALGRPVPSTADLEDVVPAAPILPANAAVAPTSRSASPGGPHPAELGTRPAERVGALPMPAPPALEEAITAALRDRPELRQASAQVRVYEHLTAAARAGKRPLLTGVGSVGKINPVPLFKAGDKPWAVGVALSVPIFTGGLVEGQVEEARRNANAARESVDELTNVVRQQVTGAVANLAAAEESTRVAAAQAVRAQDALSLATQRYQTQLGSIVELNQAQVAYATAQNDLIRAQYDRELARAALAYAMGASR